jgi:hypothetical protein
LVFGFSASPDCCYIFGKVRTAQIVSLKSSGRAIAHSQESTKQRKSMDAVFGAMLNPQASMAQAPVAQAQLDFETFIGKVLNLRLDHEWGTDVEDLSLQSIVESIQSYNNAYDANDNSKMALHQMMHLLDIVEHKVYRWFDVTRSPEIKQQHLPMFYLLDEVQREHKTLVQRTVNNKVELWVHDEPIDERDTINELWNEITSGQSFLRIINTVRHANKEKNIPEQFMDQIKVELFSSYARIMSRPQGRKLLSLFRQKSKDGRALEFELSSLDDMVLNVQLGPEKAIPQFTGTPNLIGNQDSEVRPGPGSGSTIKFAPNGKDSRIMDTDENGNKIIAPTFLGYSHETTHSAHFWEGTYLPGAHLDNLPEVYGRDMEEMLTILPQDKLEAYDDGLVTGSAMKDTDKEDMKFDYQQVKNVPFSTIRQINEHIPTEGDVRSEHGLSIRHGHKNTSRNTVLPHGEEKITDSSDWVNPLLEAISEGVNNEVNNVVNNAVNENENNTNGNCFITTACVQAANLPDDCEELSVLRHFRDSYVRRLEDGELLVKLYYTHAPEIVRQIIARDNASLIWNELMKVIRQCVEDIRAGKLEKAAATYINMMMVLQCRCC